MEDFRALTHRVETLERRQRRTATLAGIVGAAALAACAVASRAPDGVLRARGLVITDAAGNSRVVLGAPMDEVTEDARLADAVGLVVLDSAGRMSVVVGANAPLVHRDGSVGKRMGADNGLTIYDPRNGGERGGIGVFDDGRANFCLDYERDKEAVCMSVAPQDAWAAVLLNGTPNESAFDRVVMFVGEDGVGSIKAFGGSASHRDGLVLEAGAGPARLVRYDGEGQRVAEAAWTALSGGS